MRRLLIPVAVVVATVVMLAACGGGGTGNTGNSPGASASSSGATTVSAKQIGDVGSVLVDSVGRALYASDQEASGDVLCTGACTSFWMPLTIGGGSPTGN